MTYTVNFLHEKLAHEDDPLSKDAVIETATVETAEDAVKAAQKFIEDDINHDLEFTNVYEDVDPNDYDALRAHNGTKGMAAELDDWLNFEKEGLNGKRGIFIFTRDELYEVTITKTDGVNEPRPFIMA